MGEHSAQPVRDVRGSHQLHDLWARHLGTIRADGSRRVGRDTGGGLADERLVSACARLGRTIHAQLPNHWALPVLFPARRDGGTGYRARCGIDAALLAVLGSALTPTVCRAVLRARAADQDALVSVHALYVRRV